MNSLLAQMPPELAGFAVALGLSLLIGFEREEQASDDPAGFFGGIRTFPLIGLGGFLLVEVFDSPFPFAFGLVVLGILLTVSHWSSVRAGSLGLTTEVAAILTFTLGAAAAREMYWIALAVGVVAVILLHEKRGLEGLSARIPKEELRTLLRFLVLTAVILPVVPNHPFGSYQINPFKIWLVVVAVSAISYASYLLRLRYGDRALYLSGVLGGAYSSTATTVVLARKSKTGDHSRLAYAGAIIAATGMMYLRLWVLVLIFAPSLARELTLLFWALGLSALIIGFVLTQLEGGGTREPDRKTPAWNPLEIRSAVAFAAIFLVILVATRLVAERFGDAGVLVLACIMGAADVDPFILGVSQQLGTSLSLATVALAVVVAAATNNVMKGIYAVAFGARKTGLTALAVLAAIGAASVLIFLAV